MSPDKQSTPADEQEATANEAAATPPETTTAPSAVDVSPEPPNEAEVLAEQEEALPPSTVHSAAPAGTVENDELKKGREEYGEYFIGMWGDLPNFGCPYCSYASIDGNGFVELHVLGSIDAGEIRHMAALQLRGE